MPQESASLLPGSHCCCDNSTEENRAEETTQWGKGQQTTANQLNKPNDNRGDPVPSLNSRTISTMSLALPSSFASAEHRDSIQHSQVSWELNSRLIRTCTSVLHNTHVFPQGFSALPSAVPPRLPIAGICTCSVSFTHELNYQDSGNSDSNGKTVTMMMTTRNLPADNLTLILPVPQAAVTCGCLRTQHSIFFIALTSNYGLLNYFFPVKSHGVGKTSIN